MSQMRITAVSAALMDENCTVITSDAGAVVVDPGIGTAAAVLAALKSRAGGVTILLTHGHADHLWDAGHIARETGAQVLISPQDRGGLIDPVGFLGPMGALVAAQLPPAWGVATYQVPDGVGDLTEGVHEFGGIPVRVYATPGHTQGSVMLHIGHGQEAVLCGGDTVFAGSVGRTDLPGGDPGTLATTLATLIPRLPQDVTLIPGHGPRTTLAHEARTNPFLAR